MARTPQPPANERPVADPPAEASAAADNDRRVAEAAAAVAADDRRAAETLAAKAAGDRAAAEGMLDQVAKERAALNAAALVSAPSGSPVSAQLEAYAAPRLASEETILRERVTIRRSASAEAVGSASRFNARAIALPGGQAISAVSAARTAERRSVTIADRVLHDRILYLPGSTCEVTYAQFLELRYAGAVVGEWPA